MKIIGTMIIIFLFTITLMGQITITKNDFQSLIGITQIGEAYASFDLNALAVLIAMEGENQSWNITGRAYFKLDSVETIYLNYPGGAPMANEPALAGSNIVARMKSVWAQTPITNWQFCNLSDSGFLFFGTVIDSAGFNKIATKRTPPLQNYKLPLTYKTSWSSKSTSTSATGVVIKEDWYNIVDGYGTITTPAGLFPCLRLKQRVISELGTGPVPITTTMYFYNFIGKIPTLGFAGFASITANINNEPTIVSYSRSIAYTPVDDSPLASIPKAFALEQNYPNPFNPVTRITYQLPHATHLTLKIYNIQGQEIRMLVNEFQTAGMKTVVWDGLDHQSKKVTSGLYFYRLEAGDFIQSKKMMLIQ